MLYNVQGLFIHTWYFMQGLLILHQQKEPKCPLLHISISAGGEENHRLCKIDGVYLGEKSKLEYRLNFFLI